MTAPDPLVASGVNAQRLRQTMAGFATGVAIIATEIDGEFHGMTANSLTSVSLDPPLILVCLTAEARTADAVRQRGRYTVSLLAQRHQHLANRFARSGDDHFAGLEVQLTESRLPAFPGGLGWLECAVDAVHPGGDHVVVIGRVLAAEIREGCPLVFYRGRYHEIHDEGHEAPWFW